MAHILFFLNCIIGSLGDSRIFTVTRDKITLLKYMKGDVRSYTHAALCLKYVPFSSITCLFLIPLFLLLCGGTAGAGGCFCGYCWRLPRYGRSVPVVRF